VAAIVSPYWRQSPTASSRLAWFRVEHPLGRLPSGAQARAVSDLIPEPRVADVVASAAALVSQAKWHPHYLPAEHNAHVVC